jgi:hypothetical protein
MSTQQPMSGGKGQQIADVTNPTTPPIQQAGLPVQQTQPQVPITDGIQGKTGGAITMPGQSGQPTIGQPNQYSNTTGQTNQPAYNQPQPDQQMPQAGKGKGA